MQSVCTEFTDVEERNPQAYEDEEHGDDVKRIGRLFKCLPVDDALLAGPAFIAGNGGLATRASTREEDDEDGSEGHDAAHDPQRPTDPLCDDRISRDERENDTTERRTTSRDTQRRHFTPRPLEENRRHGDCRTEHKSMSDALEHTVEEEGFDERVAVACGDEADDLEGVAEDEEAFVPAVVEGPAGEGAEEVDEEDVHAADPCDC